MNKVMMIVILTYLVILVTMVYGPIAAMLVETVPHAHPLHLDEPALPHRQWLVRRPAAHHVVRHRGARPAICTTACGTPSSSPA